MRIRDRIKTAALARAGHQKVGDVRIGLGYTAVRIGSGGVGLAYTFRNDAGAGCTVFKGMRPLVGKSAAELLGFFDSRNPIASALALATANALLNSARQDFSEGDMLGHLRMGAHDKVAMVGYFAPLIQPIRQRAGALEIYELDQNRANGLMPAGEIFKRIADCQILIITATSIINNSIDSLLEASAGCRDVVLLGASTPLASDVFADTPVTLLSGVLVTRPEEVLSIVSEGGGMMVFNDAVRKVSLAAR